jgi:hypothetical protein
MFAGGDRDSAVAAVQEIRDMRVTAEREIPKLAVVVRSLKDQGIPYQGPFRTSKGRMVFRLKDQVVLGSELATLLVAGELNPNGISVLLRRLGTE